MPESELKNKSLYSYLLLPFPETNQTPEQIAPEKEIITVP
jgi:hypothetical protein